MLILPMQASGIPPMGKVENKERLDSLSGAKSPEWTAALVEARICLEQSSTAIPT